MSEKAEREEFPSEQVIVLEKDQKPKSGWKPCVIGEHISFDTSKLETYCFSSWQPVIYDMLLLSAAVEFCDRVKRRPVSGRGREISLILPVHQPEKWNADSVHRTLHDALSFLTGDLWNISFVSRKKPEATPKQGSFSIPTGARAVVPFSDGMDSRAVAELLAATEYKGDALIRIRLGSSTIDTANEKGRPVPFTSVPYKVKKLEYSFPETSARSRGFKFLLLGGLVAYLSGAQEAIVPESGQGALGPALVSVGQAYEDYRNHPLFTDRLEKFLSALLDCKIKYRFPRLWHTKGETLREFMLHAKDKSVWQDTWSCWQQSRHVSVEGTQRQCGICAACMLRRMSVHAAGLTEEKELYVWENLSAATYEEGAAEDFEEKHMTSAMNEYAIAGALHMDHLAALSASPLHAHAVKRHADQLSVSQKIPAQEAEKKLDRLLKKHAEEWRAFLASLGGDSFVANWVGTP